MARYFFIFKWPHREVDDPDGVQLSADLNAVEYAGLLVRERRSHGQLSDRLLTMPSRTICAVVLRNFGRKVGMVGR
jgi:hypothetical protein